MALLLAATCLATAAMAVPCRAAYPPATPAHHRKLLDLSTVIMQEVTHSIYQLLSRQQAPSSISSQQACPQNTSGHMAFLSAVACLQSAAPHSHETSAGLPPHQTVSSCAARH